jgi:putative copper export protein
VPRVEGWELIRFLHLLAIAVFVGGQLMLVLVVTPSLRGQDLALMRSAARRFGIVSVVALVVIIATGAAMASHFDRWGDSTLHWKIGLLVLVFVLTGLHTRVPYTRAISYAVLATSLVIFWLGVTLAH